MSIRTRRPSRTSTRISSARASSPARGCTTSTRSPRRSRTACRRTRCCRTTCSRGSTRARRSSPTSRSWTTIPPASSRTRGGSTAGCAATGRSCWWLFPFVPSRAGVTRNRLPLIARWKILDNLRRSLLPPATLLLLVLGWTVLPGHPLAWTAAGLAALAFPFLSRALEILRGPRRGQSWGVFLRTATEDLQDRGGALRAAAHLHGQRGVRTAARDRDHARPSRRHAPPPARVGDDGGERSPRRPGAAARVPRGHDGESAAGGGHAGDGRAGAPGRMADRGADPRAVDRRAVDRVRPQPPDAQAPRAAVVRRPRLSPGDRAEDLGVLRRVRRRGGPFPAAGQRPGPLRRRRDVTCSRTNAPIIAHRTSPTNIGLGLLATLAAHDLGFIDSEELVRQGRRDAHDDRAARAIRRPPAQLVRHADAGAAAAGLCLDGGQRQSGRRAPDAVGRAAGHRAVARRARDGALRRDELPVPVRSEAAAVRDRLPPAGCRAVPAGSMRRTTTCSRRKPGWPASSRSPRATCRRCTGSTSDDRSRACAARPSCSRGARRCSST